jgi:hypothetical protein
LAFNDIGPAPILSLATARDFPFGDQLLSCPLMLCDDESFSFASRYVDAATGFQLVSVLQTANDSIRRFFSAETGNLFQDLGWVDDLDAIINNPGSTFGRNVAGLFLETCALAARITKRTLEGFILFDDTENQEDVLALYDNTRFIGLKAWTGLPYVYVWV